MNNENSTSRTVMPIPLPRPVNRPSEPDPESAILCGNPAPRSFDAPDSLAACSSHRAAAQTASRPRSHSPGARPIASWHDRILPFFWKIIFLFPGHRSPALGTFPIHAGNSAFMRFLVPALRAYAVACRSCRAGSAHTAGFSASLTLPHSAARSHSPGSCSVSSWHSITSLSRPPQTGTF